MLSATSLVLYFPYGVLPMRRFLLTLALALLVAPALWGQSFTTVSATTIQNGFGIPLVSGVACFYPTASNGVPAIITPSGGSAVPGPFCAPLSNGAFTITTTPNLATAAPSGLLYTLVVTASSGNTVLALNGLAVVGSTFSIDALPIPTPPYAGQPSAYGLGIPYFPCLFGALYTRTDAPLPTQSGWQCVVGGSGTMWQQIGTGAPPAVPVPFVTAPQVTQLMRGQLANPFTLTTTGSGGASTYIGGVLNIPIYTGGGGGGCTLGTAICNAGTSTQTLTQTVGTFFNTIGSLNNNFDPTQLPATTVQPSASLSPNSVWVQYPFELVTVQHSGATSQLNVYNISTGVQVLVGSPTTFTGCQFLNGVVATNIAGVNVVFTVCNDNATGYAFSLSSSGVLTALGSPLTGLTAASPGIALDPDGVHVYVPLFGVSSSATGSIAKVLLSATSSPTMVGSPMAVASFNGCSGTAGNASQNPAYLVVADGYGFVETGHEPTTACVLDSTIQAFNTSTMALVGSVLPVAHSPQQLSKQGSTLFASYFDALQIQSFDISNPASITSLQVLSTPSANLVPIITRGSRTFAGVQGGADVGDVYELDTSNPSDMRLIQKFTGFVDPQRFFLDGRNLFVVEAGVGHLLAMADTGGTYLQQLAVTNGYVDHLEVRELNANSGHFSDSLVSVGPGSFGVGTLIGGFAAVASTGPGTSTMVLHGNASGGPGAYGAVTLTTDVAGILPVAQGGTGTNSPGLVGGTGISITGTWPNQTITNTGGGGGSTIIQVNGTPTTTTTPVNFENSISNATGLLLTVSNPSVGNVVSEISGTLNAANLGGGTIGAITIACGTGCTFAASGTGVVSATQFKSNTAPNGTIATTQTAGDNTTKLATDAFVIANSGGASAANTEWGNWTSGAANAIANPMPSCFTLGSALIYTPGTGITCNTAIVANSMAFSGLKTATVTAQTLTIGSTAVLLASGGGLISATTATDMDTNGTANQVWGMNAGATAQGWQTVSGGGTPAYPQTVTGCVSGGVLYGSLSTQVTCSPVGTANALMKWGGAATAPGSASITDNGTTVAMTEAMTDSATTSASTSAVLYSGAYLTTGSGSTNVPNMVFAPTGGTAITGWNTLGGAIGIVLPNSTASGIQIFNTASTVANPEVNITGGGITIFSGTTSAIVLSSGSGNLAVQIGNISATVGNITATAGTVSGAKYATATNCSSSANPAVCGSAAAGAFTIAAAATTVTINTTAVTANSDIEIQPDVSLGTRLGVTCNTSLATVVAPVVTARTAGTSFVATITGTLVANPACYSYSITN